MKGMFILCGRHRDINTMSEPFDNIKQFIEMKYIMRLTKALVLEKEQSQGKEVEEPLLRSRRKLIYRGVTYFSHYSLMRRNVIDVRVITDMLGEEGSTRWFNMTIGTGINGCKVVTETRSLGKRSKFVRYLSRKGGLLSGKALTSVMIKNEQPIIVMKKPKSDNLLVFPFIGDVTMCEVEYVISEFLGNKITFVCKERGGCKIPDLSTLFVQDVELLKTLLRRKPGNPMEFIIKIMYYFDSGK